MIDQHQIKLCKSSSITPQKQIRSWGTKPQEKEFVFKLRKCLHISTFKSFGDFRDTAKIKTRIIRNLHENISFWSICIDKPLRVSILPAATLRSKHLLLHKLSQVFAREIDSDISWKAAISMESFCTHIVSTSEIQMLLGMIFINE